MYSVVARLLYVLCVAVVGAGRLHIMESYVVHCLGEMN